VPGLEHALDRGGVVGVGLPERADIGQAQRRRQDDDPEQRQRRPREAERQTQGALFGAVPRRIRGRCHIYRLHMLALWRRCLDLSRPTARRTENLYAGYRKIL